MAYPSLALVAAHPLVLVLVLIEVRVDLLAVLAEIVVHIVFVAVLAEESVPSLFHLRPDFLEDLF